LAAVAVVVAAVAELPRLLALVELAVNVAAVVVAAAALI
jgi:hypothetical protein